MSRKELILDAIRQLPATAGFEEAIDEIRILQRVEEGEHAADEGRLKSHEEVRAQLKSWITK